MAVRGAAARRYAQAVFEIAKEDKTLDQWLNDLKLFNETFGSRDVIANLEDPNLNETDQRKVLAQALKPGAVSDLALNLLYILVRRQRLALLPRIVEVFQQVYNKEKGIIIADVTSAIPMDAAHQKLVSEQLSRITGSRTVELHVHEDPRILGGLVTRIGDELIDASVATRLAELSERLA